MPSEISSVVIFPILPDVFVPVTFIMLRVQSSSTAHINTQRDHSCFMFA